MEIFASFFVNSKHTTTGVYQPREIFSFDSLSLGSKITCRYDDLWRLRETYTEDMMLPTTISYQYDRNGNPVSMNALKWITYPTTVLQKEEHYQYDQNQNLLSITDGAGQTLAGYDYDLLGRMTEQQLNSGLLTTTGTLDKDDRLLSLNTAALNLTHTYETDELGTITAQIINNTRHEYGYDPTYQLTGDTFYGKTYSYDPVGNRNPLSNTYDQTNKLMNDPAYTYEYDDNGNMVKKTNKATLESTRYDYSSEGQLVQVTQGSSYLLFHRRDI